jgi:hypothetical protein
MADLNSLTATTLSIFDPATLTGSYQALNGTGFTDAVKMLKIYNGSTTQGILISLDGVTDHDYWPPGATLIIDCQANHSDQSSFGQGVLNVRLGQIIYGKLPVSQTVLFITGYK